MHMERRAFLSATVASLLNFRPASRVVEDDPEIAGLLKSILEKRKVPGLTAAIVRPGRELLVGSVGVRKFGSQAAFTTSDLVHLGSCTKAMTATMIATLVEEGKLSWTSKLLETLPESHAHHGYRDVTLSQLLSHRAGLPANAAWRTLGSDRSTTEQRKELLRRIIEKPPHIKVDSKTLYSNVGYTFAALMAETVTMHSWEQLMKERLFEPLGMKTAGFGAPGPLGRIEQPWGHKRILGSAVANQIDNAAVMGPAGTVHCSMADWAKFLALHIQGGHGESTPILKPESFHALQTPDEGQEYAKGWVQTDRDWAGGRALYHTGSNTTWFAAAWFSPKRNLGFLAATNEGGDDAERACDDAVAALIKMNEWLEKTAR